MKKILLLCLMTMFSFAAFADDEDEQVADSVFCLVVVYSGEEDYFAFDAQPVATFSEFTVSITQDGEDAYSIEDLELADIQRWYFTEGLPTEPKESEPDPEPDPDPDGIAGVSVDGAGTSIVAGHALMTGLQEGTQVYIYTADGQTVGAVAASKDGTAVVDLNSLKAGQVYILRTPSASYKIVK